MPNLIADTGTDFSRDGYVLADAASPEVGRSDDVAGTITTDAYDGCDVRTTDAFLPIDVTDVKALFSIDGRDTSTRSDEADLLAVDTADGGKGDDAAVDAFAGLAILSFSSSATTVSTGEPVALSWSVAGASSISIDNGIGTVGANASRFVWPIQDTMYTLMADDASGHQISAQVTIAVVANPVVVVTAGGYHACKLKRDGTASCWGNDDGGQAEAPEGPFTSVSAGGFHTCGLRADGSAICWGDSHAAIPAGPFKSVSAGQGYTCGVRSDESMACWGAFFSGTTVTPPTGVFTSVSVGWSHACAIATDGTLVCWGTNVSEEATPPSGVFVAVSAGSHFACALAENGSATCWGQNDVGQTNAPAEGFASISAGMDHACGIRKSDNTAVCWGNYRWISATPSSVNFTSVSCGFGFACGVGIDGTVTCWGKDDFRQVPLSPETGAFAMGAGGYFTAGSWRGYIWTATETPNSGTTISPSSFSSFSDGHLCIKGTVSSFNGRALLEFNLNQGASTSSVAPDARLWQPTGMGLEYKVTTHGNTSLRIEIQGAAGYPKQAWCAGINGAGMLKWTNFNTLCWDDGGTYYDNSPLRSIAFLIPGGDFDFCVDFIEPM